MAPERVAATIVEVVERGKAPEVSVPRWMAALQVVRLAAIPPRSTPSPRNHDGTVRIWDLAAGKELWSLPFPQSGYGAGHAFTPDGKKLVAGGHHELTVWDIAQGKLEKRLATRAERAYALPG